VAGAIVVALIVLSATNATHPGRGRSAPPGARLASTSLSSPTVPSSPVDPLTADEITTAFQVIQSSPQFPPGAFFPLVTLKEPSKAEVLAFSKGQLFRRQAFANVFDRTKNRLYEAVVDLRAHTLISWVERPDTQPAVFASEYGQADAIVRQDPRWQHAMRSRGLNPADVYLDVWAPGDEVLPTNVAPGTRLLRALSFFRGSLPNPYDRPIEGVTVTVDMNHLKVVDVVDTGIRPVNTTISGSSATTRSGLKPLIAVQPNGPSFQIAGTEVTWQGWHFRVSYNQRDGLVLYQVGYAQKGTVRPILYRMAMDEVYVPYALPDVNWVWRAALDSGEYNLGQLVEPLQAGVDVPTNATFFDEIGPGDGSTGSTPTVSFPHAVALYERDAGSLWDRTDPSTFVRDARFGRELVATSSYVNGNYTYTTEYIFRMDGGIDVRVGATGTTLNRGVSSVAQGDQFGSSVAANIAAPSHQHFFNFRIDFDVDGTRNQIVELNTHTVPSRLGDAFVTDTTTLQTEQFRDLNPATNRRWAIQSATNRNALGQPSAYELDPIDYSQPYSQPGYTPLQHAAFAQHALWVTQYRADQLYAVGAYPNQGSAGQGLPKYVAQNGSVNGQDSVVWYTAGFTHDPTVEEYPVMTRETIGFSMRPAGFFNQNPALDAP
jgi:primary-amine oxidase